MRRRPAAPSARDHPQPPCLLSPVPCSLLLPQPALPGGSCRGGGRGGAAEGGSVWHGRLLLGRGACLLLFDCWLASAHSFLFAAWGWRCWQASAAPTLCPRSPPPAPQVNAEDAAAAVERMGAAPACPPALRLSLYLHPAQLFLQLINSWNSRPPLATLAHPAESELPREEDLWAAFEKLKLGQARSAATQLARCN